MCEYGRLNWLSSLEKSTQKVSHNILQSDSDLPLGRSSGLKEIAFCFFLRPKASTTKYEQFFSEPQKPRSFVCFDKKELKYEFLDFAKNYKLLKTQKQVFQKLQGAKRNLNNTICT